MIHIQALKCKYVPLAILLTAGAFAQTGTLMSTSVASYGPIAAPDSIAAAWGTNFTSQTAAATTIPLPTSLGGVQISIVDSVGAKFSSASLFMASPGQINYQVPATAAVGKATVTVTSSAGTFQGPLLLSNVAPGIFTASADGKGVPAAQVFRVSGGQTSYQPTFMMGQSGYVPAPINLSPSTDSIYLVLYGSGIRRHSGNPVEATINGVKVPVIYAAAQNQYPGLDQVNLGPLPQSLAGQGTVNLQLTVDGSPANTVQVAFQ